MSLKVCDLDFSYTSATPLLSGIDITFPPNSRSAIIGANGSGKSTLLRLLAGILKPRKGFVELHEKNLASYKRRDLAKHIAFMKQNPEIPSGFTVEELVLCGRFPHNNSSAAHNNRIVKQAIADSGAEKIASRRLNTLSGGELQKAFLALALAQEAEILLLDEPVSALDPAAEIELFSLLDRLQQQRSLTVIFVSHNLNHALRKCDFVAGLKQGQLLFHGTPKEAEKYIPELYELPESLFSRSDDGKLCLL